MAINVTPSFQPGQVDSFDPSQTVGQFAKGAGTIVELGRNMISRATEQIALEKMKALAPLAKEQAKEELKRKMMIDLEIQGPAEQGMRGAEARHRMQVAGGGATSDMMQTPNALNAAVVDAVPAVGQDPNAAINQAVSGSASEAGSKLPQSNYNEAAYHGLGHAGIPRPNDINASVAAASGVAPQAQQPPIVINAAPAAPSPINRAVSAAALAPRKAIQKINDEYSYDPNQIEDERARLAAEKQRDLARIAAEKQSDLLSAIAAKGAERRHEIEMKKSERSLRNEYDTYIDKNGNYQYVKIGTTVPEGWKKVATTGTTKFVNITDGSVDENGRLNIQRHKDGDDMPDGWDVVVPSMETGNVKNKQKTIEDNDKKANDLRKLIAGEKGIMMDPEELKKIENEIFDIENRNRELRGEKPLPPPVEKVPVKVDTTNTSHWYNPSTWFDGKPKEDRVKVIDKNGNVGSIPKSQLKEALDSEEYTLSE